MEPECPCSGKVLRGDAPQRDGRQPNLRADLSSPLPTLTGYPGVAGRWSNCSEHHEIGTEPSGMDELNEVVAGNRQPLIVADGSLLVSRSKLRAEMYANHAAVGPGGQAIMQHDGPVSACG